MNIGLIAFNKELIEDIKTKIKGDNVYEFILIDKNKDINEFSLEIDDIPKNDSKNFLIENKYAQCSFNLANNSIEYQKYFIDKAKVNEIKFNNKTTKHKDAILGGIK